MSDILHFDLGDNKSPYQAITEIDIDGKQAAIEAESALKRAGFEAAKAQQAARVEQYEGSLAGRMGLKAGGIPAAIVNVPAAAGTSAWRYAGTLDQAFVNLGQATYAGALEEEDYKAYNRLLTKQGTPEDIVRMGSSRTTVLGESKTVGEMFQEMSKLRELSSKIGQLTDTSASVDSSEKDALTQDALNMEGTTQALRNISEGTWEGAYSSRLDSAKGFGKDLIQLAANAVKAGANNPEGVFTYLMENSAQYASAALGTIGKVALAGFTSGYASDYYNKGIEAYQLKNGGQLPPEDVRTTMLLQAGAMAGAEYLGTVMASGASALPRALAKGVTEGAEESAVASLKQTLKNVNTRGGKLLNPLGVVGRAGNVAEAAGGEAATEGTQTYLESAIQGEEASPEDIYIGATIGGLTGGALATPSAAFGMSKEKADQLAAAAKEKMQRRKEIAEAVATGNADKFLEPTSPTYDVVKGMEVLQILAEDDKKTPEERAAIVAKAQDTYDELATPLATLQQELKAAGINLEDPEWEEQMKAEAEAYRTRIATLEENGGSQEEIAKAEKSLAVREERIAAYADPEVQAKIAEVKAIEDKLDSIKGIVTDISLTAFKEPEFTEETSVVQKPTENKADNGKTNTSALQLPPPTQEVEDDSWYTPPSKKEEDIEIWLTGDLENDDEVEEDKPTETKKAESVKLLIRSMSNLGKLSVEEATALAEDTNNGLTEKQRKYLRSYTAARIAYNATQTPESVGETIVKGDKKYGNLGVTDYRARVASSLQQNNMERAVHYSEMLGKWAANHTGKLAVMDQAFAALKDDNDTLYVGATPQGEWKVLNRQMTEAQRKAHGAFRVRKNSAKLIERVRREADILNTAHAEILAMLDMDTATPSVEAQKDTQIQEPTQDATVTQAPQEQAPKASKAEAVQISSVETVSTQVELPEGTKVTESLIQLLATLMASKVQPSVKQRALQELEDTFPDVYSLVNRYLNDKTVPFGKPDERIQALWKQAKSIGVEDVTPVSEQTKEDVPAEVQETAPASATPLFDTLPAFVSGQKNKVYAGIGSRKVPPAIAKKMTEIAAWLAKEGYTLRSGHALGADVAFENGAGTQKEIFTAKDATDTTRAIAKEIHPNSGALGKFPLDLMARNTNQIFGANLDTPVDFVLTWTPDGAESTEQRNIKTGGTGQAIDMASRKGVPVINMANEGWEVRLRNVLGVAKKVTAAVDFNGLEDEVIAPEKEDVRTEPTIEVEEEVTEDSTTSVVDGLAKPAEEVAKPVVTSTGKVLRALEEGASYLAQFMAQQNIVNGFKKPLASVQDFFSKWTENSELALDYVSESVDELTAEQAFALEKFRTTMQEWLPIVDSILVEIPKKNEDKALFANFVTYTKDADGNTVISMEENVKAAIAYAAYSFIQNSGGKTYRKTFKEINALLGYDENTFVSPQEAAMFSLIGERRGVVILEMGRTAMAAISLVANNNTPLDVPSRLEANFGALALRLLIEVGSVDIHNPDMDTGRDEFIKEPFVRFPNALNKPNSMNESIATASQGSNSIVSRLMGIEEHVKEPTLKPVKTTQRDLSVDHQEIPEELEKHLNEANKVKNYADGAMMSVLTSLEDEYLLPILGWNPRADYAQKNLRIGLQAKNDSIVRKWENTVNFFNNVLKKNGKTPFYLKHVPQSQNRSGIQQNVFNPQADTNDRYLINRAEWETTVQTDSIEQVNALMIVVAAGLGIDIDKKSHTQALEDAQLALGWNDADSTVNASPYKEAIDALYRQKWLGEALTKEDKEAIRAAVLKGKNGLHTLKALLALVDLVDAFKNDKHSFKTNMVIEVDGVTNGPMLTNLLWGTYNSDAFMQRGGFFVQDVQGARYTDYNVWRGEPGHNDLYEVTSIALVNELMKSMDDSVFMQKLSGVTQFTGELDDKGVATKAARTLVKTPITQLHFGSGMETVKDSMFNEFMSRILLKFDAAIESGKRSEIVKWVVGVNKILEQGLDKDAFKKHAIPEEVPTEFEFNPEDYWLEYTFSAAQITAFRGVFDEVLGLPMEKTLNIQFDELMQTRKTISYAANEAFTLYQRTYDFLVSLQEEKNGGTSITVGQRKAIEKYLEPMAPRLATPFSSVSENSKTSGIAMFGKKARKTSVNPNYRAQTKVVPYTNAEGKKVGSIDAYGQESVMTAPGVRGASMGIHSVDARTSHTATSGTEALNNHDANMTGLGRIVDQAKRMNTALWNTLMTYSPVSSMADTLNTTFAEFFKLVDAMPEDTRNKLFEHMAKELGSNDGKVNTYFLKSTLTRINIAATKADFNKYSFLSRVQHVGQYGYEGGSVEITDEQREEAERKANSIVQKSSHTTAVARFIKTVEGKKYLTQEQANKKAMSLPGSSWDSLANRKMPLQLKFAAIKALYYLWQSEGKENTASFKHLKVYADFLRGKPEEWNNLFEFQREDIARKVLQTGNALKTEQQVTRAKEVSGEQDQEASVNDPVTKADTATVDPSAPEVKTWYGPVLGTADPNGHTPALLAGLVQNKLLKKLETLQLLNKLLGDSADTGFYKMLLSKLNNVLPEFTLVYMTKDTPANYIDPSVQFGAGESAKYVFYPKSGKHVIYVLGTDYAASQVSVDVIMHELVHAALSRLIETDAEFAAKLLELMSDVRQKLEAKGQMTKNLEPAFANVDEFLTYGLTHKDFQKLLASVEGKPIKRGVIETAFQAFATLCLKALGMDARRNTALKQLFILGAEGMSRAEKQTEKAATQMIIRNHTSLTPQEQDYTTLDIFDALDKGTLTAPFKRQLKGLLAGMVNTLHGPFGTLGKAAMQKQPIAALDVYMNALAQDRLPFASDIKNSGFMVSEQEQFVAEQIEATVKAALEDNEGHTTIVYTQLVRMFKEAVKKYPTPESMIDWANASPSEQAQTKALHDFLFNVKLNEDGKSDYLARFAGMVLGVEQVNNMFSYGSKNRDNTFDTTTFLGRMLSWFDSVLGWFENQVAKTWDNQIARDKLDTLLNTLVEIEAKKRARIKASADKNGIADFVDKGSVYLNETAKKGLLKFSQSKIFTESKNSYVKFAGTAVGIIAQDKIQEFGEDIRRFHDYARNKKHGIVMGLLREISGESDTTASMFKMLRITKHLETLRKQHIDQTSKTVAKSFGKRKFSKEESEALSNYVLRSGMYVLLDKYSLVEIEQMLSDPSKLKAEVTKYEQELVALSPKFANFWITSAKALGRHLVTDSVVTKDLLFNAESIAKAGGTPIQDKISASMASQAEPLIDKLATLQALVSAPKVPAVGSKNPMGQHEMVAKIMREQNARTDGNGVMYTLLLHKTLMEESKNTLFKGSSTLMRKAYIPEVLNPHTEITAVSQEEGKKLEKIGYRKVGVLNKDARDPSTETKVLYTVQGGLRPWLSGVYSFTGIGTKGTSIVGSNRNPFTVAGQMNRTSLDNLVDAKHQDMRDVFTRPYTGFDPDAVTENYMAPLRDAHMNIVNYRYMMEAHTKDTVMERDNRFNHLLGTLEGNIFDKQESPEQNKRATQALYDFYQANKRMDSRSFVFVGLGSNDPEMENVYRMFPDSTKEAIRSIWGQEGMWVRRDLTDIAFGYRKVSLAQTLFDSAAEKQMFAQMIVGLFEVMFAGNYPKEVAREKALRWLKNKGDIWEEIVAETKDIIVVKTGIVLLNNVISNILELKAFGVPTLSILKHHRVAIKAAVAYRKDAEELHKLKQIRDIGFAQGKDAEIERDIVILQDAINSNPVHKLMEEGLMPTIVEDVSADEDIYSYKSKFSEKVDKYMGKLPAPMRTGLRFMYMTHDSFLYRKLSEATQLSDFVARYTLYQHEISKKRNPLTHENAVRKVSDAFINYDIPSHRGIQWGNDMGLLMFTKYYLRIQKVILRTMRDSPVDALLMLALNQYTDALPMLYDSGFFGDSYGSGLFHSGALEFPGTLDELMTVNTVL